MPSTEDVERVVVGVDGSEGSLAALRQAVHEARCHGAELCPVIAWTPPGGEALTAQCPVPEPEDLRREWIRLARARLDAACARILGDAGADLTVSSRVLRGRAEDVLTRSARKPTDLLVMGAGSHGRLHRLLFGSVSRLALKRAQCPVLVVHPDQGHAALDPGQRTAATDQATSADR
ncbi:universal stress protein [Streptomyces lunalinharesii]|uniref:UspA domain-containing protein n=1 Tax=Streptomyces lunalinharesii TaxID=333384 RepID=A0ABN3RQP5_9ACTN